MSSPIGILLLEDDPNDAGLIEVLLEADHLICRITCVQSRSEFLAALENAEFDLILSDYKLPSFDGLSALNLALSVRPNLPFIFVSGTLGEEAAIEALKIGATDYVLKTRMSRLVPAVRRALSEAGDRASRQRAEDALRRREKELRDTVEAIPAIAFTTQPDGSSIWTNRQWVEFSGLSVEETSGSGWQSAIHPDDLLQHVAKWHHSMTSGEPFENEARHRSANGEYRWFLVRAVPLRDEQGTVLKWYGILTDITERKRAEAELRESEQNYRTLFESIDEGFCTIEVLFDQNEKPIDYHFLQLSPSFERQTGIKNAAGRRMREIAPEHEEHWFEIYGKIALTGEPMRFENEAKQLGRWYDVYAFRVEDPQRRRVGILFNDITERKRAEAEARDSEHRYREVQAELAHAGRVATMGQLMASIAHEIKQPIAAVVNGAHAGLNWLDAQPPDLEEVRQTLGFIVSAGKHAGDVMDRIRALMKRAPPRKEDLDINEALLEVIALTRGEVLKNGVSVRTQLAEGLPAIRADRVQLQQVIINLIINAVEAMRDVGEEDRELLISTRNETDGVCVEVQDSGPGFAPADLERLFDAFYTTKSGGLGLGLSICRSIIEAHNGRLWASPNLPRGAIFGFIAPANPAVES
ncbi:PAS domain S-box protein [Bradyrhizobium sp. UFLA05-153]